MKKKNKRSPGKDCSNYKTWRDLPNVPVSKPSKGSISGTGDWRTYRPEIKRAQCNKCGICYIYCPDGVILFKEGSIPKIDYTYCKGCGICKSKCPKKAVEMIRERQ